MKAFIKIISILGFLTLFTNLYTNCDGVQFQSTKKINDIPLNDLSNQDVNDVFTINNDNNNNNNGNTPVQMP
ncbi:MAG: hypothetical protein D6797_03265, partial [Bdellovibrio sp.]